VFPYSRWLVVEAIPFKGTILAPFADVLFTNGNLTGTIVAKNLLCSGEIHAVCDNCGAKGNCCGTDADCCGAMTCLDGRCHADDQGEGGEDPGCGGAECCGQFNVPCKADWECCPGLSCMWDQAAGISYCRVDECKCDCGW